MLKLALGIPQGRSLEEQQPARTTPSATSHLLEQTSGAAHNKCKANE